MKWSILCELPADPKHPDEILMAVKEIEAACATDAVDKVTRDGLQAVHVLGLKDLT